MYVNLCVEKKRWWFVTAPNSAPREWRLDFRVFSGTVQILTNFRSFFLFDACQVKFPDVASYLEDHIHWAEKSPRAQRGNIPNHIRRFRAHVRFGEVHSSRRSNSWITRRIKVKSFPSIKVRRFGTLSITFDTLEFRRGFHMKWIDVCEICMNVSSLSFWTRVVENGLSWFSPIRGWVGG